MELLLAVLLGGLFGFALHFVGATKSKNLIGMMSLTNLSIMKIIIFAIGFSSALLAAASFLGLFDVSHLSVKGTHLGVVIGGLIFGVGFGWAGTCPGTCVADSSSGGFKKALVVIGGGLLGAWIYSLSYGFWENAGLFKAMDLGKLTMFNISDKYPSVFNLGYGGLLIMGLVLMAMAIILPTTPSLQKKNR